MRSACGGYGARIGAVLGGIRYVLGYYGNIVTDLAEASARIVRGRNVARVGAALNGSHLTCRAGNLTAEASRAACAGGYRSAVDHAVDRHLLTDGKNTEDSAHVTRAGNLSEVLTAMNHQIVGVCVISSADTAHVAITRYTCIVLAVVDRAVGSSRNSANVSGSSRNCSTASRRAMI